jgi:Zn-dependent peptidase ImmA (M78 family)
MTPARELEIEKSAEAVRFRLFVYNAQPINLKIALARIGDMECSPKASFKILPKAEMKFVEAFADCTTNTIFIQENFPNELDPEYHHHRFTLAHELGHLALHHNGVRSRAVQGHEFRKQAGVVGVGRDESEASYWAGAFLMPTSIVTECETPPILSARCGVSIEAAKIRKENIERRFRRDRKEERPIPENTKRILAELFNKAGAVPKSFKINKPDSLNKFEATGSAQIQGYQPSCCTECGHYELLQEGGCVTCQSCGDSNCN